MKLKPEPRKDYLFRKVLIPFIYGCDPQPALVAARAIVGHGIVLLIGIVPIGPDESLSHGAAPAREVRRTLRRNSDGRTVKSRSRVRVSHEPWNEINIAVRTEKPDLLVMALPDRKEQQCQIAEKIFSNPPCDMALLRGPIPEEGPENILLAVRGGPYSELALRFALAMSSFRGVKMASIHALEPAAKKTKQSDAPYRGIGQVLDKLPEVKHREIETDDPIGTIIDHSKDYDLLVVGAGQPKRSKTILGPVTERILLERSAGVIVVKTKKPIPEKLEGEAVGQAAISILVDKWFAENTFHAGEFSDLNRLLTLKKEQDLTISLALPTLNEEKTIGQVISSNKKALMDGIPLLDEIVLVDSNSTDRTREIAEDLGIPVFIHQEILPQYGPRWGKGEALWKSLYVTRGDILIWIDTDIVNIHPRFVYGIIGPLLANPRILYCKGFYRRPLRVGKKMQAGGGGRVTELTARPLFNLFFPELSGIIQPLAGEYGGHRSVLERIPFYSGYGVETGLLIEILENFGMESIAQVDLLERIHHNQPLESLSKMSFAIIQVVMHKLEQRTSSPILHEVHKTMKLIRRTSKRYFLEVETIAEEERPPILALPEYRARHPVSR